MNTLLKPYSFNISGINYNIITIFKLNKIIFIFKFLFLLKYKGFSSDKAWDNIYKGMYCN